MRALLLVLALAGCAAGPLNLSDDALAALAAKPFDKAAKMGKSEVVGLHHRTPVLADYPCSDLCPQYTTRIIHYDKPPGADCGKAGGVTKSLTVPIGIAVTKKDFCVPKVLVDRGLE